MKKDDIKERLLESTLRLISEKGYLGATTREIAKVAGVTELTLFRHFGSKEKLFEDVLKRYTFLPKLREILPGLKRLPYEKALKVLGAKFFETLKERKSLIRIMLSEINIYPEKIRAVYSDLTDELIRTLAGYIKSLQKRKVLRQFSSQMVARAFLGVIFSYFLSVEIIEGRDIDKSEMGRMVKEFTNMFVKGTLRD